MQGIDFKREVEFYSSKYLDGESELKHLVEKKDLNDILSDSERLRKKELIKFEKLEREYKEKFERLEFDIIRKNKKNGENEKNIKKILNTFIEVLDEIEGFKEILEEREEVKTLKWLDRTLESINKKLNYAELEKIKSIWEQFNEEVHYCVEVIEDKNYENETVIEEIKKGYKYRGKVIRESKVVVVKNERGV